MFRHICATSSSRPKKKPAFVLRKRCETRVRIDVVIEALGARGDRHLNDLGQPGIVGPVDRDLRDQTIAPARDVFDVPGALCIVSEFGAELGDDVGESVFRDELGAPDGVDDLFFRGDLAGLPREKDQNIHSARTQLHSMTVARDSVEHRIDRPLTEREGRWHFGRAVMKLGHVEMNVWPPASNSKLVHRQISTGTLFTDHRHPRSRLLIAFDVSPVRVVRPFVHTRMVQSFVNENQRAAFF